MNKVKIKFVDDLLKDKFKIKIGDTYAVVAEGRQELSGKYGYLINTKNKLSIVVYANEVEVIEKQNKNG